MANFNSAPDAAGSVQIQIKITAVSAWLYSPLINGGVAITFGTLEQALSYMRDNVQPISIAGAAGVYDLELDYKPNTAGMPWSEQGAGEDGTYNG